MAKDILNNSDKLLENLLKKWELYWNHYKLQHEAYERRRHVIWLIQSALAVAWYKTFYDCHSLVPLDIPFPLIISVFATIFSLLWFFMCRRERESIFFTEEELRDTEDEIIKINKCINFDYFKLRKVIFGPPKEMISRREELKREKFQQEINDNYWDFNTTFINLISNCIDLIFYNKNIKSVKFVLDFFIPLSFFITWGIILIYTSNIRTKDIATTIAILAPILVQIIYYSSFIFLIFWLSYSKDKNQ